MRSYVFLAFVMVLGGCLGQNRKPAAEPPPPSSARAGALVVYREIVPPGGPANTLRLTVERDGHATVEHGSRLLADEALEKDEQSQLQSFASAVKWGDLPVEYLPRVPRPDGKTYEIAYGGHSVTSHDGADQEDEGLVRLRRRLHEVAGRIEAAWR